VIHFQWSILYRRRSRRDIINRFKMSILYQIWFITLSMLLNGPMFMKLQHPKKCGTIFMVHLNSCILFWFYFILIYFLWFFFFFFFYFLDNKEACDCSHITHDMTWCHNIHICCSNHLSQGQMITQTVNLLEWISSGNFTRELDKEPLLN